MKAPTFRRSSSVSSRTDCSDSSAPARIQWPATEIASACCCVSPQSTSCAPSELRMEELDASFLGKFLEHLEPVRRNSTRTRNNRLAALQAFFST